MHDNMTTNSGSSVDLKTLFRKLGHQLEEIRVRALLNIESKLEHKLLCDADLVHEKHLLIRLLEWFNFSTCPHQENVLKLLKRLVQHMPAASIVLDVGGLEFLTLLRPNVDKELQPIVDDILDCLFHLPSAEDEVHAPECIYQHQARAESSLSAGHAVGVFDRYSDTSFGVAQVSDQLKVLSSRAPERKDSPPEPQVGYFGNQTSEHAPGNSVSAVMAKCFKFSTFPWVSLTPTDKHVLWSTDNSLRSSNRSLVKSACEFLSDVVFQDFPAEVFLQRPGIVKSLLSLFEAQQSSLQAVETVSDLASQLQARIYYYQDPTLYSPKLMEFGENTSRSSSAASLLNQSLTSSDSRPSLIGRSDPRHQGDGHDASNATSSTSSVATPAAAPDVAETTDSEDTQQLQFQQWTLPHFCACALEKLARLLKSDDEALVTECLNLFHQLCALLEETVVPEELWQDTSMAARDLTDRLQETLEEVFRVILHHHPMDLADTTPAVDLSRRHVTYIGCAVACTKLIDSVIPVNAAAKALADDCASIPSFLCQDEYLATAFPSVRTRLLPFLQILDAAVWDLHCTAQVTAGSLSSTCVFMTTWKDLLTDKVSTCVQLASDCLPSLAYSCYLPFIAAVIEMCSVVCKKTSSNPTAVAASRTLLVNLLSHPVDDIRTEVYEALAKRVKECLGVERVVETSVTRGIWFVLDHNVLRQITYHGMRDQDKRVRAAAEASLQRLLQCQLLVAAATWQQLLDVFIPVLPALQGFADLETPFGKLIVGMLPTDVTNLTGALPKLERFKGTLRLMFSTNTRVRSEAVGRLAWFLTSETDSVGKLPQFSALDVGGLADLLQVEFPRALLLESPGASVFQVEGLQKVLDIFVSKSVEDDVRKSAVEQLSVMLHDVDLHAAFTIRGGQDKVLTLLHQSVVKTDDIAKQRALDGLVAPLLRILRHLVQHDSGLRLQLAHDSVTLYALLRCSMMRIGHKTVAQDVAEILMFLLFGDFAIPDLNQRYRLPLKLPKAEAAVPELREATAALLAEPALSAFKLAWNTAWFGGVEALMQHCRNTAGQSDNDDSYSERLRLSAKDKVVVCTSHVVSALKRCVHDVENATSHDMVSAALTRLGLYLILGQKEPVIEELYKLDWMNCLHRFFLTIPSSTADELLLTRLLRVVEAVLRAEAGPAPGGVLAWLGNMLHHPHGALLNLIGRNEASPQDSATDEATACKGQLNRQILKFVRIFVGKLPYSVAKAGTRGLDTVRGALTQRVMKKLAVTDTAHFYNLASLQATLSCLSHVTARPGWSFGCSDADSLSLCLQMLQSLLEIVSAFHIGRGGASMSYMGCGVTRGATLCLRHLAFEMASQLQSKDWPRNWLHSRQATADTVGESGLHWLTPLWTYRDAEVRASGLGVAVALTMTEAGRITMTTQCQHIVGGPWGAAFGVLLDAAECSSVRQQAALLLVNLTSEALPAGDVSSGQDVLYGPVVRSEETQVSLTGLAALLALLHHSHFYAELQTMLSMYYPQPAIHPVSVAGLRSPLATPTGSQSTALTAASGSFDATFIGIGAQVVTSTPAAAAEEQISNDRGSPTRFYEQRDQAVGNSSSATSDTTLSGQEYQSVTTPCLVSALCQFVQNVLNQAPHDTLLSLKRENILQTFLTMIDAKLLEAYVSELKSKPATRRQYLPAFHDLLAMHASVLRLLQACALHDVSTAALLLQDKQALRRLLLLLGVSHEGDDDSTHLCSQLWCSVLQTLTTFLQLGHQQTLTLATPILVKTWNVVAARAAHILQDESNRDTALEKTTLTFLTCLFSEEAKLLCRAEREEMDIDYSIRDRLDWPPSDEEGSALSSSSGSVLCQALIKIYDGVSLRSQEQALPDKSLISDALKSLLVVSTTAKAVALEGGFLETLCEHVKRVTSKLNLEALKLDTNRKKDKSLTLELVMTLELLRNFMLHQPDVKAAAYESGLSDLLHRLWAWCQVEPTLMTAILHLLATYVANCSQASTSLAFTSAMTAASDRAAPGAKQLSSSSLVHCLLKLAQRDSPHTGAAFTVLASLSLSQECRGIMCKNNFVDDFPKISLAKKKNKAQKALESLWLDLLVNLSFSTDGQNMILKVPDSVGIIMEFGNDGSPRQQKCALSILRNLCFHTPNKPKLLANDKLVPFLLRTVEEGREESRAVSSSALFALIHNSQKAKVTMKNAQIVGKVEELFHRLMDTEQPTVWLEKCAQNLQDTLALLRA